MPETSSVLLTLLQTPVHCSELEKEVLTCAGTACVLSEIVLTDKGSAWDLHSCTGERGAIIGWLQDVLSGNMSNIPTQGMRPTHETDGTTSFETVPIL